MGTFDLHCLIKSRIITVPSTNSKEGNSAPLTDLNLSSAFRIKYVLISLVVSIEVNPSELNYTLRLLATTSGQWKGNS